MSGSVQHGAFIFEPVDGSFATTNRGNQRVITFQFNSESLKRTLSLRTAVKQGTQPRNVGNESLSTDEELLETISLKARFDGKEGQFEEDRSFSNNMVGLHRVLSALENLVFPQKTQRAETTKGHRNPPKALPLVLFSWGENRLLPVRITQLSIDETEFSNGLVPLRAEVDISMEVIVAPKDTQIDDKNLAHYYDDMVESKEKAANEYFKYKHG